ncbi:MAG TPA: PAS domain-containing sensor histidine kinase [Candidatus Kapabacteria bacterium]|nr:PAS domain-containing sensor histidine kinase [Candidatus Kapabacteria bacterium]HOM05544.1 PAS domain-containing sensor histidine kinase [Candidatus Kapabacteria bacterium]HPU23573.1 PAS domain-containing sensor histidine kinase [Candidatus Kapabacteria bacterium]
MKREDIYNQFIENINIAFVLLEIIPVENNKFDYIIFDANKAFEDFFEVSKSDFLNKSINKLSYLFSSDILAFIDKLSNVTVPSVFELSNKNTNRFYEITVYPLDKKYLAIQILDITKRKLLEKAYSDSEKKYRTLADKSPISIIVLDNSGKVIFANDYFFTNYLRNNYCKENVIGKDLFSQVFCSAEYCNEIKKVLQNHIIELKDVEVQTREIHEPIFCNIRGVPLVHNDENNGGIIIIEDITEKKLAEKNLHSKAFEQQLLLDNVDLLIWYMDSPSSIKLFNHSFADFFGVEDTSTAITLDDFLPHFEASELREIFNKVWKSKYPQYFDKFIFNKLGNKRLLKIKVTPKINFQTNEVEFLVCSAMDITEQRRNEEEMKNLIVALKLSNRLTDQRATEIMELNKQLRNSKEQLKASLAAKDKFFSVIAHDLISPFQGFMSLTKYLSSNINQLSTKDIQELATALNKSAINLHKLLENLLNWSRIQRGKIKYTPEFVDLFQIVELNVSLSSATADAKKITLHNELNSDIIVFSDLNILNTILRNLISNAIKFTNYGGNIWIGCKPIDDNYVELYVKDDGVGMDEATLDNLFKIDSYNSTLGTANEVGTGLGLVLCKEFAEINHSSIRVESELEKGSTFFVTLPLKDLRK